MEEKLRLLANWCSTYEPYIDSYSMGDMEKAVKRGEANAVAKVGEYLQEILDNDTQWAIDQLKEEYKK